MLAAEDGLMLLHMLASTVSSDGRKGKAERAIQQK